MWRFVVLIAMVHAAQSQESSEKIAMKLNGRCNVVESESQAPCFSKEALPFDDMIRYYLYLPFDLTSLHFDKVDLGVLRYDGTLLPQRSSLVRNLKTEGGSYISFDIPSDSAFSLQSDDELLFCEHDMSREDCVPCLDSSLSEHNFNMHCSCKQHAKRTHVLAVAVSEVRKAGDLPGDIIGWTKNRDVCTLCDEYEKQKVDDEEACECMETFQRSSPSPLFPYGGCFCSKGTSLTISSPNGTAICTECEEGYYKANLGNSECLPCPERETSERGASDCVCKSGLTPIDDIDIRTATLEARCICPAGKEWDEAEQRCVSCETGFFSYSGGSCILCIQPRLSVKNQAGTNCICGSNTIEVDGVCECVAGTKRSSDGRNCVTECPSYEISNSLACEKCPDNHVVQENQCHECNSNQMVENNACVRINCGDNEIDNGETCVPCKSYERKENNECVLRECEGDNLVRSVSSPSDCVCVQGFYLNTTSVECQRCPEDTFKIDAGNQACQRCPLYSGSAGTVDPETRTACACRAGATSNGTACELCAIGFFKETPGDTSCSPCSENRSTKFSGAVSENMCVCTGGFFMEEGVCEPCPFDTFSQTVGAEALSSCKPCPFREFNPRIGQTQCVRQNLDLQATGFISEKMHVVALEVSRQETCVFLTQIEQEGLGSFQPVQRLCWGNGFTLPQVHILTGEPHFGARCGDGYLLPNSREECDDGNNLSGDGCDTSCRIEAGFACEHRNVGGFASAKDSSRCCRLSNSGFEETAHCSQCWGNLHPQPTLRIDGRTCKVLDVDECASVQLNSCWRNGSVCENLDVREGYGAYKCHCDWPDATCDSSRIYSLQTVHQLDSRVNVSMYVDGILKTTQSIVTSPLPQFSHMMFRVEQRNDSFHLFNANRLLLHEMNLLMKTWSVDE